MGPSIPLEEIRLHMRRQGVMISRPHSAIDLISQLVLAEMVTPPGNRPLRMPIVIIWPPRPSLPAQTVYMGKTATVGGRMDLTLAISLRTRPSSQLDIFCFSAGLPPPPRLPCLANSLKPTAMRR